MQPMPINKPRYNKRPINKVATKPAANQVTPPSTSSMPNMLAPQRPGSQYQLQTPGAVQSGMNTMNGMNFGATPQPTNGTATQPSAPMNPGFNGPGMPVMNAPNNQAPTGAATQPQWMIQQPGFASAYTPVQPGAVQAAFAKSAWVARHLATPTSSVSAVRTTRWTIA